MEIKLIKAFHVNPLLISKFVHKPSAHELPQTKFVHAQVHATDEKCFLRDHRGGLSKKERKSESTHYSANRWNHTTYENVLSMIPIYDLSHWHVLACEAHPKSSAKCVGANSVYCSTEAGDSMARTGHRGDSEEFALQGWCEHLQETYERFSRCPPRSANGVDFHAWACTLG
jgi:hypothetical protein